MKTTFIFLFSLLAFVNMMAQKESLSELNPDISSLVIYTEGVEISHVVPIKLVPGRNLLVFKGLSAKLDARSIRFNIDQEVSVLSISHKIDYLTKNPDKPRIKTLKDSLAIVSNKIQLLNDELNAIQIQREMLMKNQEMAGQNNGLSALELQKGADFFQTRVFDLNKRCSQIRLLLADLTPQAADLTAELNQTEAKCNYQRTEISVLVNVDQALQKEADLRYYIADAGWAPWYEIKATEINQPITLNYRAKVFNNTDIDWKDVTMLLSTADPNKSASAPRLDPWRLSYYSDSYYSDYKVQQQSNLNDNYYLKQEEQSKTKVQRGAVNFTTISVTELSIDLNVKTKYTIPSNAKPYIVDITEYNLPAIYKHIAVPKADREVYLLAQIIDWEDLNLVEGPANVYFDNTFVGKSYISTHDVNDTLSLSLGRDKKVMVTRNKVKDYTSKQFIGSKKKESYRYQFDVKNNRKTPIDIDVMDQVPVSENSEIEVTVEEISGASYQNLSGILTWNYKLQPDEKKQHFMQYTIKYPKNKHVSNSSGKKYRAVACPSF